MEQINHRNTHRFPSRGINEWRLKPTEIIAIHLPIQMDFHFTALGNNRDGEKQPREKKTILIQNRWTPHKQWINDEFSTCSKWLRTFEYVSIAVSCFSSIDSATALFILLSHSPRENFFTDDIPQMTAMSLARHHHQFSCITSKSNDIP